MVSISKPKHAEFPFVALYTGFKIMGTKVKWILEQLNGSSQYLVSFQV